MCQEPGSGGVRRAEKGRVPVLSWTDPQQAFGHTGRGVSHPSETSVVWEERSAQPREPRSAQLGSSITHCPTPSLGIWQGFPMTSRETGEWEAPRAQSCDSICI